MKKSKAKPKPRVTIEEGKVSRIYFPTNYFSKSIQILLYNPDRLESDEDEYVEEQEPEERETPWDFWLDPSTLIAMLNKMKFVVEKKRTRWHVVDIIDPMELKRVKIDRRIPI